MKEYPKANWDKIISQLSEHFKLLPCSWAKVVQHKLNINHDRIGIKERISKQVFNILNVIFSF